MTIFEKYPGSTYLRDLLAGADTNGVIRSLNGRIDELFRHIEGHEGADFQKKLDEYPQGQLWEMIVAKIIRESGYAYSRARKGPDFHINHAGRDIYIEATCPMAGDAGHPASVPPLIFDGEMHDVPIDQILLRICSGFAEKRRKFRQYVDDGTIPSNSMRIIAISSMTLIQARSLDPCAGIRISLGSGGPFLAGDLRTGEEWSGIRFLPSVAKPPTSAAIDTMLFLDDANADISGLLYSDANPHSFRFSVANEAWFIHNPNARCPLPAGLLRGVREIWTLVCASSIGCRWRWCELRSGS